MVNDTAMPEDPLFIASDDVGSSTSLAPTGSPALTPSVGGYKDEQHALNLNQFSWVYELGLSRYAPAGEKRQEGQRTRVTFLDWILLVRLEL